MKQAFRTQFWPLTSRLKNRSGYLARRSVQCAVPFLPGKVTQSVRPLQTEVKYLSIRVVILDRVRLFFNGKRKLGKCAKYATVRIWRQGKGQGGLSYALRGYPR